MEWVQVIELLFTGGVLVGIFTLPATIKRANAEARSAELDNLQKVADGWKELAEERQEACAEKDHTIVELNTKIDGLYETIGRQRMENSEQQKENTRLQVKMATDEVKLCMVRGCEKREPQSGY